MSTASAYVIRWGRERARTGTWGGDVSTAFLFPLPDRPVPSQDFVLRCLEQLRRRGYRRVVTGALSPNQQPGFFAAGFEVLEQLHLLVLDGDTPLPPVPPGAALRRVWGNRRAEVLHIDAAAFQPFWQLDSVAMHEALVATPRRHFRVAVDDDGRSLGYAICGAGAARGFVQRLAVQPGHQRQGTGRRLLLDGLHWLRRRAVRSVVVNTQMGNQAALALYRSVGFRDDPSGLSVLTAAL
jgi:ribosomal-protein-alanine N-acetyltransferase